MHGKYVTIRLRKTWEVFMSTVVSDKKISDMTAGELRILIRETIQEIIDPDYGLQLRPEVEDSLLESMEQKRQGRGIPLEEVKRQLGLQ